MVTVQFASETYRMEEKATSLSVGVKKEGKTEVDFNVTITTMSLNDTTAEGREFECVIVVFMKLCHQKC